MEVPGLGMLIQAWLALGREAVSSTTPSSILKLLKIGAHELISESLHFNILWICNLEAIRINLNYQCTDKRTVEIHGLPKREWAKAIYSELALARESPSALLFGTDSKAGRRMEKLNRKKKEWLQVSCDWRLLPWRSWKWANWKQGILDDWLEVHIWLSLVGPK